MPEKKTGINPLAENGSAEKYATFIKETIKVLKNNFFAQHSAGKTVEEIRGTDGIEERHVAGVGLKHIPMVGDGMVSADPAGCLLQRVGAQVHQVNGRMVDREAALIKKIARADPYIEVRISDVLVVKIENLLSGTFKNALHFENQDFPVIDGQEEIGINGGTCKCFL